MNQWLPYVFSVGGPMSTMLVLGMLVYRGKMYPASVVERAWRETDEWKSIALDAMRVNAQLAATARATEKVLNALPEVDDK